MMKYKEVRDADTEKTLYEGSERKPGMLILRIKLSTIGWGCGVDK